MARRYHSFLKSTGGFGSSPDRETAEVSQRTEPPWVGWRLQTLETRIEAKATKNQRTLPKGRRYSAEEKAQAVNSSRVRLPGPSGDQTSRRTGAERAAGRGRSAYSDEVAQSFRRC